MPSDAALTSSFVLADALTLMAWWNALIFALLFVPWGMIVTGVYDKDAARWYLKREVWNIGHMVAAVIALGVVVAAPLPGLIALPIAGLILLIDLLVYPLVRNADERVPDSATFTIQTALAGLKPQAGEKKDKGDKARKVKGIFMVFRGKDGIVQPPEDPETPQYEIRIAVEDLIGQMLTSRATQLELAPVPQKKGAYVAIGTVDSVRSAIAQLPADRASAIIDFVKSVAGLDVNDRRRRLKGRLEAGTSSEALVHLGVTTLGTTAGMRMTLVLEPEKRVSLPLDRLGLHPQQLEDVGSLVDQRGGVVLVTTPPHQGRTTLLYSLIKKHDAYTSNVQTVETDSQMLLEGVTLNEWDAQTADEEFSNVVRSVLRRDPDAVGVAEMADDQTAREASSADLERIRVYLSFSAADEIESIKRYVAAVGDAKTAAKWMTGLVAGRLLRRLCENCKVAYRPTPDLLRKLGLPADTAQLYREGGTVLIKDKEQTCPVCDGGGYFGAVGAYAVYRFGTEERKLIAAGDWTALQGLLRQNKHLSVRTAAVQHIVSGVTSIKEVQRAMSSGGSSGGQGGGSKKPPKKPPAQAAPAEATT